MIIEIIVIFYGFLKIVGLEYLKFGTFFNSIIAFIIYTMCCYISLAYRYDILNNRMFIICDILRYLISFTMTAIFTWDLFKILNG